MAQKVYDFITASNYTYDNTKIEIDSGIVKLVNYTPNNEIFYANYNTNINGSRGLGVLTGTAYGGAIVSGGKLDLTHQDLRYVKYQGENNISDNVGTIRFKYTPNYNQYPSGNKFLVNMNTVNYNNEIMIAHFSSSAFYIKIRSESGYIINSNLGSWKPTQGQEYEIELNWDIISGATRLFIDGVQFGNTRTETGTKNAPTNIFIGTDVGASALSNFKIDDFQIFSTVQHTANYTPEPVPENSYSPDKPIIYPKESWNPTSPLTILAFTETLGANNEGSIGYQISTDSGTTWKYWDGSAFVVATSDQYNDADTINTVLENLTLNSPDDDLLMKVILISNGEQQCELDTMVIEILKDINNLIISVDFPRQVVLGDTIDIKCTMNESIFDWKIRAEIYDNSGNSIKLANTDSGGSDSQIDIIDQVNGTFFIRVAKDLTTDFNKDAKIEIEIENSANNVYTVYKSKFKFQDEQITWTDPSA